MQAEDHRVQRISTGVFDVGTDEEAIHERVKLDTIRQRESSVGIHFFAFVFDGGVLPEKIYRVSC